jgi:hypothetical protein
MAIQSLEVVGLIGAPGRKRTGAVSPAHEQLFKQPELFPFGEPDAADEG